MFELKIQKIGTAQGIALPDEVVERLRLNEGDTLFLVEKSDGTYLLTSDEVVATAQDIMRRYSNTLRVLAK